MWDFVDAALGFPAAIFSFLLVVVIAYWLLVLLGAAGVDLLDADTDGDAGSATGPDVDAAPDGGASGVGGALAVLRLGGVPVTLVLSLLITLAWFVSLVGTVLLHRAGLAAAALAGAGTGVILVALVTAWLGTSVLVLPVRRLLASGKPASRHDFVGRTCVIRTGSVSQDFGQAEVTAEDGSSAIVQVRQAGDDPLGAGSQAVIYDYDATGEFFWVSPLDIKDQ
jgi:hypothetical protein